MTRTGERTSSLSIDSASSLTLWLSLNLFPHLANGSQATVLNTGSDGASECMRISPTSNNANVHNDLWVVSRPTQEFFMPLATVWVRPLPSVPKVVLCLEKGTHLTLGMA